MEKKNRRSQWRKRRQKEAPNGNFRTGKYNNQNKNSLDGLNSQMNMREERLVNFKIEQ